MVVNYIYDVVVDTQFHKFHGRPFARGLRVYLFLMKDLGRRLPWLPPLEGQQDDLTRTMLSITILRADNM